MLSFGVGGANSGVSFHFHGPGWSEVLHGRKLWMVYLNPTGVHPTEMAHPRDFADRVAVWLGRVLSNSGSDAARCPQTTLQWLHTVYPTLREEDRPLECVIGAFLIAVDTHAG